MSWQDWLRSLISQQPCYPYRKNSSGCEDRVNQEHKHRRYSRLQLDILEDRLAPAVHDLTTSMDYTTIQAAVDAANPGDILLADAGTYAENVTINKSLTLEGAQHGVDARTRSGTETILDAASNNGITPITVSANDVIVDGFTVQNATNANNLGGGIYLATGTHGTHIVNNIIQNNIIGLFVSNNSAVDQPVIQDNLFQNNTQTGPSGGTDIYADQFTAGVGGVNNVLIDSNKFTNTSFVEDAWALGIGNTASTAFSNITFSNNAVTNHGRGVYFFNTTSSSVSRNTITSASHYAIGLFGSNGTPANSSFTISSNILNVNGSGGAGVLISDDSPPGSAYSGTLTLSGNSYTTSGSDRSIDNESAAAVDATGDTFNTVAASSATRAQQFAIV